MSPFLFKGREMGLRVKLEYFKNWKLVDEFHDKMKVDNCEINLSGFACQNQSNVILTGSAGGFSETTDRALYELIERLVIFEAKEKKCAFELKDETGERTSTISSEDLFKSTDSGNWKEALSNGVAIHKTPALAKQHAKNELLERDAILASWFGLTRPKPKTFHFDPLINETYSIKAYELPTLNGHTTAVAVAVPNKKTVPLLYGFACDSFWDKALERAYMELIQRIGFLMDEPIEPLEAFEPSALYHQEYYLQPENASKVLNWLSGLHYKGPVERKDAEFMFIEFDIPELTGMSVVKAISGQTIPLIFGKGYKIDGIEIDSSRYIHPIA